MNPERNDSVDTVNGVAYQYSSDWIHRLEGPEHWMLYWHQQKIMEGLVRPGDTFLEIGVGSGFTAHYLRSKGMEVTTIDIDADKQPDIVANLVSYEFTQTYDHVLAFEVFEHIPFAEFQKAVQKIRSICRKQLFFSVPRNEKTLFSADLLLPWVGKKRIRLSKRRGSIREPHHFWEVDHGPTPRARVEATVRQSGYTRHHCRKVDAHLFYCFTPTPS